MTDTCTRNSATWAFSESSISRHLFNEVQCSLVLFPDFCAPTPEKNIWLSLASWTFGCVHQPLSDFGAPPHHAGQEAYKACVWMRAESGCPQFNMRGSVGAGVTPQCGPANQNSELKGAGVA